jgi:hypothetical protein
VRHDVVQLACDAAALVSQGLCRPPLGLVGAGLTGGGSAAQRRAGAGRRPEQHHPRQSRWQRLGRRVGEQHGEEAGGDGGQGGGAVPGWARRRGGSHEQQVEHRFAGGGGEPHGALDDDRRATKYRRASSEPASQQQRGPEQHDHRCVQRQRPGAPRVAGDLREGGGGEQQDGEPLGQPGHGDRGGTTTHAWTVRLSSAGRVLLRKDRRRAAVPYGRARRPSARHLSPTRGPSDRP